jgi:hypothetical protein
VVLATWHVIDTPFINNIAAAAAAAAATMPCCCLLVQTQLTSYATTKAHYESKHPKEAVPPQEQLDK